MRGPPTGRPGFWGVGSRKEEVMRRSRVLAVLIVAMALALPAPPVRGIGARQASPEASPAPRFTDTVTVDGRRLGLTCAGSGRPTVVLVGGLRLPAEVVWPPIVDALSPVTRVCAFDRAGQGPSDPQPRSPQTAADVVADLHAALEAAGDAGPFVPVGFHFGGLVARLYASTDPGEVAGLVLVEGIPPGLNLVDMAAGWFGEERGAIRDTNAGRDPIAPSSPLDLYLSEAQVVAAPASPRVPAVVVVAGKIPADEEEFPGGIVPWEHLDYVGLVYDLHAAQARDLGARIVVATESGLLVPFEQPEVMIAAIEDVVQAVRDPSSWATPAAATPVP